MSNHHVDQLRAYMRDWIEIASDDEVAMLLGRAMADLPDRWDQMTDNAKILHLSRMSDTDRWNMLAVIGYASIVEGRKEEPGTD